MIKGNFPIDKFSTIPTPFYYYDLDVLRATLNEVNKQKKESNFHVHYALKANVNTAILKEVVKAGMGADCVSGGEVQAALDAGFCPEDIVFAGVGKSDWEINLGLDNNIFCFNVESVQEMEVINQLAQTKQKVAKIALRINPNVDAHTHHYITTGLNENKFGINMMDLDNVVSLISMLKNIKLIGVHFHIGSQITDMTVFENLSIRVNELQEYFRNKNIKISNINVGGGLGINYHHPNHFFIPDFESYFNVFRRYIQLLPEQNLHFELGRSIVAQSGTLVSKVLYIKHGIEKKFAILDAGFTDLIRPALYQAYHRIENITSSSEKIEKYDVVGPICESSDVFDKEVELPVTQRGDLLALRSAGAYGEIMASQYNLRKLPKAYTSDDLKN